MSVFAVGIFVPVLYRNPALEAFGDFSNFVESVSYETSKTCQVLGSSPCRGAKPFVSISYKHIFQSLYRFCTRHGFS
jgi:hypothetical protein